MALHDARVARVPRLSPQLVRITLTAPTFAEFVDDGPDQRCKLLLPRAGQDRPLLPAKSDWFAWWQAQPVDVRPVMRTYTIRAARPAECEADIDFVLHGDGGPGSRWAASARPGARIGVVGVRAEYEPLRGAQWQLIAGDDTALPAISAILERMPSETPARVFLEVHGAADEIPLRIGRLVDVTWLHRGSAAPGEALLAAVRAADLPSEPPYAWIAGESHAIVTLRRHLVRERGFAKDAVTFLGYWRRDGAIDPD